MTKTLNGHRIILFQAGTPRMSQFQTASQPWPLTPAKSSAWCILLPAVPGAAQTPEQRAGTPKPPSQSPGMGQGGEGPAGIVLQELGQRGL